VLGEGEKPIEAENMVSGDQTTVFGVIRSAGLSGHGYCLV
jgi:hypothetical protein